MIKKFLPVIVTVGLIACSSTQSATLPSASTSQAKPEPVATRVPVPVVTASPTPTQSAEDTARFERIKAEIEESNRKFEQKLHENKMELHKDKYCMILEQSEQPLSERCKKRLANIRKEDSKASQSNTPPDDSWLDKP